MGPTLDVAEEVIKNIALGRERYVGNGEVRVRADSGLASGMTAQGMNHSLS